MDDKNFINALYVPGLWIGWLLVNIVLTLAAPVVFFIALFDSRTPTSMIIELIEIIWRALGLPVEEEQ